MSRKNVLTSYTMINASMASSLQSPVIDIQWLDNVCVQASWTGTATGSLAVQARIDKDMPWETFSSATTVSGTGHVLYDLNQLSMPQIQFIYTTTLVESADVATVADVAGSLAGKYFTIDGADGTNWYVWYKVSGTGTDPALPGRTGVEVDLTTGDTANTVASDSRTAMAAITSITTIGGATNHITFVQSQAGHGAVAAGTSGFGVTYVASTATLLAKVSGKMI